MNDIIVDEKNGISVEEQKEILTQINGITEKNKQQLSAQRAQLNAKKKGAVFPLAVNAAAAAVLIVGVLLLISFNSAADLQARKGNAVYNLTERALIEEIRRDTAEKIAAKEREIAGIVFRLEEVDSELALLYSSNQELTLEQREAQERLLSAQITFRGELSKLNEERTGIIEDSRAKEARLKAQLDERTREYAVSSQKSSVELESAAKELNRLNTEREKLESINALLTGSLALSQTTEGNTRGELLDLQTKNSQLQNNIIELQKNIDTFKTSGSDNEKRITELNQAMTELRAVNNKLEQSITEKDRSISSLQTENSAFSSQITELRTTNNAQGQRITTLESRLSTALQSLQE